jgi:hypothetical protein
MRSAGDEVLAEQAGAGYRRPLMRRLAVIGAAVLAEGGEPEAPVSGP